MIPPSSRTSPSPRLSPPLALVVGGTGMLAGVVRGLVRAGCRTGVVARDGSRIRGLAAEAGNAGNVFAVAADYTRPDTLAAALDEALAPDERIATAVLWVHGSHRPVVHELVVDRLSADALVVDVLGSAALDPSHELAPTSPTAHVGSGRTYRTAVLGFTDGPAGPRWLTHQEISDGLLTAVGDGRTGPRTHIVGRVEPWSDRPC